MISRALRALAPRPFPYTLRTMVTRSERNAALSRVESGAGLSDFDALFRKLDLGLTGMKESNKGFKVSRELAPTPSFVIETGRATLRILGDVKSGRLSYSSPKVGHGGGFLTYKWDAIKEHWVNTEDGHFLIELLTRELIHNAPGALTGYPTW